MARAWRALALLLGLYLALSGCGLRQRLVARAYIDQILSDPAGHLGKPVELDGNVTSVRSTEPLAYVLGDASGRTVEVRTQRLPAPGARVRLLGQVAQDEANVLVPIVIEGKRSEGERTSLVVYAVLLFFGSFFLFVLALELFGHLRARAHPATELLPTMAVRSEVKGKVVAPRDYREGDRFHFVVLAGQDRGREYVVSRRRAYIGRGGSRKNDVELSDGTVSRHQAVLCYSRKKKQVLLLNEAVTNPTAVNGVVAAKSPVRHGDTLRMGHCTLQLFFEEVPAATVPDAPAPPPAAAAP